MNASRRLISLLVLNIYNNNKNTQTTEHCVKNDVVYNLKALLNEHYFERYFKTGCLARPYPEV